MFLYEKLTKSLIIEKLKKGDHLVSFIIQLGAENEITVKGTL